MRFAPGVTPVGSHAGEQSDTPDLADRIRAACRRAGDGAVGVVGSAFTVRHVYASAVAGTNGRVRRVRQLRVGAHSRTRHVPGLLLGAPVRAARQRRSPERWVRGSASQRLVPARSPDQGGDLLDLERARRAAALGSRSRSAAKAPVTRPSSAGSGLPAAATSCASAHWAPIGVGTAGGSPPSETPRPTPRPRSVASSSPGRGTSSTPGQWCGPSCSSRPSADAPTWSAPRHCGRTSPPIAGRSDRHRSTHASASRRAAPTRGSRPSRVESSASRWDSPPRASDGRYSRHT